MNDVTITPAILYFGIPVVLLSTENEDGSFNLAPMSSAWALGQVIVLGLAAFRHYYGLGTELGHSFRSQTRSLLVLQRLVPLP